MGTPSGAGEPLQHRGQLVDVAEHDRGDAEILAQLLELLDQPLDRPDEDVRRVDHVLLGELDAGAGPDAVDDLSGLAVQVVATVVAAAVLFPLRDRLQRRVDRLFYGDRGVPYEALARLGRLVEESAGTESVLDSMVKTIADSLRLPYVALELRLGDGWRQAAVYSQGLPSEVTAFPLFAHTDEFVGVVVIFWRV